MLKQKISHEMVYTTHSDDLHIWGEVEYDDEALRTPGGLANEELSASHSSHKIAWQPILIPSLSASGQCVLPLVS
jgi:hypothetical protein